MHRFYNILQYLAIKRKLTLFLLLSTFINGILWLTLIPIWHFPDEQAHFAQVAYVAEKGRNPNGEENDLTEEIYTSEQLLGTARDKFGNNRFTFHPEYRIEYISSYVGQYEASISALTKTAAKTNFIHQEASRYPLLYYLPATIFYKLFYTSDLFTRVYAVRFWSLFLFLGTVVATFLIGKYVFPRDNVSRVTLATLVGFQPMMVFANVGVNSDALGNLFFTVFLYLSVIIIMKKNIPAVISLLFVTAVSVFIKPQFIVMLPMAIILFLWVSIRDYSKKAGKHKLTIVLFSFVSIILISVYAFRSELMVVVFRFLKNLNIISLWKYTLEYTLPHSLREVLPWYWGIYDWLGVTYPRWTHRVINRILAVATLGVVVLIYRTIKQKWWVKRKVQAVIFLIFVSVVYFFGLSFYDWMLWYTTKYQLGIQGRYFFPVITIHMLILLLGIRVFFPEKYKMKIWATKSLGLLMVIFNYYALYTVARTYYSVSSLSLFLIQTSQYKPWIFKGMGSIFVFSIFFVSTFIFLLKYLQYHDK